MFGGRILYEVVFGNLFRHIRYSRDGLVKLSGVGACQWASVKPLTFDLLARYRVRI